MKLHRFYLHELSDEVIIVHEPRLLHQWDKVLRFTAGQRLILFNGSLEYECELDSIGKRDAALHVVNSLGPKLPVVESYLLFAPVKRDGTDLILQKATELGVMHFAPILAERSNTREFNTERAQKIIIEAAEQCGRTDIPSIHSILTLAEALPLYAKACTLYAADQTFDGSVSSMPLSQARGIIIGPEGGWTDRELALLGSHANPIHLGSFTLRAETAAIVGIHQITHI